MLVGLFIYALITQSDESRLFIVNLGIIIVYVVMVIATTYDVLGELGELSTIIQSPKRLVRLTFFLVFFAIAIWLALNLLSTENTSQADVPITLVLMTVIGILPQMRTTWDFIEQVILGRKDVSEDFSRLTSEVRQNVRYELQRTIERVWIEDNLIPEIEDVRSVFVPTLEEIRKKDWYPLSDEIEDSFTKGNERLIILGGPGVGKSIELYRLLRHLHIKSVEDENFPVPVLFKLQLWKTQGDSYLEAMQTWMIEQLKADPYNLSSMIAIHDLVLNERIIPLFDGLDEVPPNERLECINAINAFVKKEDRLVPLRTAITCQLATYEQLEQKGQALSGTLKKIRIRGLNEDQIQIYFDNHKILPANPDLEDSLILDDDQVAKLVKLVQSNDFLRTPFWLRTLLSIYGSSKSPPIPDGEVGTKDILDLYLEEMFKRYCKKNDLDRSRFESKERDVRDSLTWLSRKIEGDLFTMEQLEPKWLDHKTWFGVYLWISRLTYCIVLGLSVGRFFGGWTEDLTVGVTAGIVIAILDTLRFRQLRKRKHSAAQKFLNQSARNTIVSIISVGLVVGFACCLTLAWTEISDPADQIWGPFYSTGFVLGILYTLWYAFFIGRHRMLQDPDNDIHTKEKREPKVTRALSQFLVVGSAAGFVLGIGAIVLLQTRTTFGDWLRTIDFLGGGVLGAFMTGFLVGVFIGGPFGVVIGSSIYYEDESSDKTIYENGIHRTFKNAIRMGVVFGGFFAVFWGLFFFIITEDINSFVQGVNNGIGVGLISFLWHGGFDIIQHYTLRLILYIKGNLPLRFSDTLFLARQLVFLRPVGGGYRFYHNALHRHFCENMPLPEEKNDGDRITLFIFGVVGSLVLLFAIAFIDEQRPLIVREDAITVREYITTDFCYEAGTRVMIEATSKIKAGNYIRRIGPEGTESGVIGMALGDTYDVDSWQKYPHGALMCLIPGHNWDICFKSNNSPTRIFSVYPRRAEFELNKDGCIEFDLNDAILVDNLGAYVVSVSAITPSVNTTSLAISEDN